MTAADVRTIVAAHEHELIAMRRMLHSQPELSGAEYVTTEMIAERLLVEGLQPVTLSSGTGLVCDIPLDADADLSGAPVVALRADIDALAMEDRNDTPYRSQHAGIAHACGHDVHTAAVLGAGLALLELRRSAPRRGIVRLVFEPAEEVVPGGAIDVIGDGWIDGVRAIFGVHCDPKLDTGSLGLRVGALTSAADQFEVILTGPGGHTARPQLTVDLVRWMSRVADRLSETITRMTPQPVTVVLGAAHSGAAANVIPASAMLRGSFRTADRETWLHGERLMAQALAEIVAKDGIGSPPTWRLDYTRGVPPVVNDAATTALAHRVATAMLGSDSVVDTPQSVGGDSFAWYLERIPGTYIRLGTHDPREDRERRDLHSATFDVDERAIAIGSAVLAGTALASVATD